MEKKIKNWNEFLNESYQSSFQRVDYDHLGESPKFDQEIKNMETTIQQMDQNSNPDDILDKIDEFRLNSLKYNYSPSISSSDRARYILFDKLEKKMKELGLKYTKRHNWTDEEIKKSKKDEADETDTMGFF